MKKSYMFVSPVLISTGSITGDLLIAEQEKALRKEEFELLRHRLMVATRRVQDLKATIYFNQKQSSHV